MIIQDLDLHKPKEANRHMKCTLDELVHALSNKASRLLSPKASARAGAICTARCSEDNRLFEAGLGFRFCSMIFRVRVNVSWPWCSAPSVHRSGTGVFGKWHVYLAAVRLVRILGCLLSVLQLAHLLV